MPLHASRSQQCRSLRWAEPSALAVSRDAVLEPLTNPTAHGGIAADAFRVVIPSMPGYGFSGKRTATGWDPGRIVRAWAVLQPHLFAAELRAAFKSLR